MRARRHYLIALAVGVAVVAAACGGGSSAPVEAAQPDPTTSSSTSEATSTTESTTTTALSLDANPAQPDGSVTATTPAAVVGDVVSGHGDSARTRRVGADIGSDLAVSWVTEGVDVAAESRPVAVDGVLYVVDPDRVLRAFSLADGEELWRVVPTAGGREAQAFGSPLVTDGTVVVEVGSGIAAFDAQTGEQPWEWGVQYSTLPLVSADGVVYTVTSESRIVGLDVADGSEQLSIPVEDDVAPLSLLALDQGVLVFATYHAAATSDPSLPAGTKLVAHDLVSGARLWETDYEDKPGAFGTNLLIAEGRVITGPLVDPGTGLTAHHAAFDLHAGERVAAGIDYETSLHDRGSDTFTPSGAAAGTLVAPTGLGLSLAEMATAREFAAFDMFSEHIAGSRSDYVLQADGTLHLLSYDRGAQALQHLMVDAATGEVRSVKPVGVSATVTVEDDTWLDEPELMTASGNMLVAWLPGNSALVGFTSNGTAGPGSNQQP